MAMSPRLLRPRATGFDPRSIGSLAGWWDASDSSTVTLVSGVVSQWNDKSGNARHFTQTTGANRPSVLTAERNGKNVLNFGGSPISMTQTWTLELSGGNTWIMVLSHRDALDNSERPLMRMTVNTNALQRGAGSAAQTSRRNRIGSFVNNTSSTLFTADQQADSTTAWQVISSVVSTTQLTHAQNGTVQGTPTTITGTVVSSASTTLRLCTDGGAFSNCHVAEVLVYSKALTSAERLRVERWLGGKWGITIA